MARKIQFVSVGLLCSFAAASVISIQTDVTHITLAPFWQYWDRCVFAVLLTFSNYALRIFRWRWYLNRLGHSLTPGFTVLTYIAGFAFTVSPGKLGELIKARYYTALGISLCDVVAAFSVERLSDLLVLLLLSGILWTAFPQHRVTVCMVGIAVAGVSAFLTLWSCTATAGHSKLLSKLPSRLGRTIASVARYLRSTNSLLSLRTMTLGLPVGLLAWGAEGLGLGILSSVLYPGHIDAIACVGIYAMSILLGALSFLPGGIGTTETVMAALLVNRGMPLGAAALCTLACRMTTLWLGVSLGWIAVVALRRFSAANSTARFTEGSKI